MRYGSLCRVGAIFFFIGLMLQLWSWHLTYPIYIPGLDEITFTQFYPLIWPGITLSLIGLFLIGYYSKRKSVRAICASVFPVMLYSHVFYFSYIATSDCGTVKAFFEVFHQVGINSSFVTYFQYPTYFTLNEITSEILGIDVNGIAVLFFALFGILLGLYLFLSLFKIMKNSSYQIAFLGSLLYFISIFSYLNYQWVPQTIALVFFFLSIILFDKKGAEYKLLSVVIFTAFVFTHAFIPVIFLLFFGLYIIKKKECKKSFLIMSCIYCSVLIYYTTFYFPVIAEAFKETVYGFGGEYSNVISKSLRPTTSLLSQIISSINRVNVPLIWFVLSVGSLIEFIKKRTSFVTIILGITAGFYLGFGLFFSILGLRALQILFIPLVIGIGFFIVRKEKMTLTLILIILILSIFQPIRSGYDHKLFQLDEEENACNFLTNMMPEDQIKQLGISVINYGYFKTKYIYANYPKDYYSYVIRREPDDPEFYHIFNSSMKENAYLIYNPKLGKEIILNGLSPEEVYDFKGEILLNNKIYESGKTFILTGK